MELPRIDLSTRQHQQKAAGTAAIGIGGATLTAQAIKTQPVRNAAAATKTTTLDLASKFNKNLLQPAMEKTASVTKTVGEKIAKITPEVLKSNKVVAATAAVLTAAGICAVATANKAEEA